MATPTGDDAVEHYQTQVPFLRRDFEQHLSDIRGEYERSGELFTNRYQTAVTRAAENEVRKRAELATKSLKDAIDGGWRPAEDELRNTWVACLNPNHYEKDSRTDIKWAINEFTDKLGKPITPELQKTYDLQIGRAWDNAAQKSFAELKMHLRLKGPTTKGGESEVVLAPPIVTPEINTYVKDVAVRPTVFIAHGRDGYATSVVEKFIREVGLTPIVLEDQPNEGLTIIEKYEKHAETAYGVAILSPDDVGCLKGEETDSLMPRARQNVIFELGYMFAKIGRNRVAVLLPNASLEKPTNIDGLAWIHFDTGDGWKEKLRKELRAAGFKL